MSDTGLFLCISYMSAAVTGVAYEDNRLGDGNIHDKD